MAAILWLGMSTAHANPRAWPLDVGSDRYYIFTVGSCFPECHRLEIWSETNGLRDACSVPKGLPVRTEGHPFSEEPPVPVDGITEPAGQSGLQTAWVECKGIRYPADTLVLSLSSPVDLTQPPSPPPSPPSVGPGPTQGGGIEPPGGPVPPEVLALARTVAGSSPVEPTVVTIGAGGEVARRVGAGTSAWVLTGIMSAWILMTVTRSTTRLRNVLNRGRDRDR